MTAFDYTYQAIERSPPIAHKVANVLFLMLVAIRQRIVLGHVVKFNHMIALSIKPATNPRIQLPVNLVDQLIALHTVNAD